MKYVNFVSQVSYSSYHLFSYQIWPRLQMGLYLFI